MTPSEARELKHHLQSAAKILKANTPQDQLQDFESIELAARQHMLETIGPTIGEFFFNRRTKNHREQATSKNLHWHSAGTKNKSPKARSQAQRATESSGEHPTFSNNTNELCFAV